jgi:hypothetical protein
MTWYLAIDLCVRFSTILDMLSEIKLILYVPLISRVIQKILIYQLMTHKERVLNPMSHINLTGSYSCQCLCPRSVPLYFLLHSHSHDMPGPTCAYTSLFLFWIKQAAIVAALVSVRFTSKQPRFEFQVLSLSIYIFLFARVQGRHAWEISHGKKYLTMHDELDTLI